MPGASATTPLGQLRVAYWRSKVNGRYAGDLETLWLKKVISDNGRTPSNTDFAGTLWKEMVASFGYPVSVRQNENKKTFFSTNNGTP